MTPEERAKRHDNSHDNLQCSFCGKSKREVKKLIAGPLVYICDGCIGLCNDIIAEEVEQGPSPIPKDVSAERDKLLSESDLGAVDLGLDDATADAAWGRAMERIQARGGNPHVMLATATNNVNAWRGCAVADGAAGSMKLTKPQREELHRLAFYGPQNTFGSSRTRVQNTLCRKGLAEYFNRDGRPCLEYLGNTYGDQCRITPAGRALHDRTNTVIDMHVCTVCIQVAVSHPSECDCGERHWPALCCLGCDCRSYEAAHE